MLDFSGQIAWVTGGSRGIGRATALTLMELGAAVAVNSRKRTQENEISGEQGEDGKIFSLACDVSDWTAVGETLGRIEKKLGAPDVLVNNAAVLEPLGPTWQTEPQQWARTIQVNLIGAYHCIRAVLPRMIERGKGTIVNVSSGAAGMTAVNWSAYAASKAGLDHLTRSLALELQGTGVRINALYPGLVETAMIQNLLTAKPQQLPPSRRTYFENAAGKGRVFPPQVTARLIAWLASEETGELTGAILDAARDPSLIEKANEAFDGT